jgi:hypothetical protein
VPGSRVPAPFLVAMAVASMVGLAGSNGPMAALGIADPRKWSGPDWISDLVPRIAYGTATSATLLLGANGRG